MTRKFNDYNFYLFLIIWPLLFLLIWAFTLTANAFTLKEGKSLEDIKEHSLESIPNMKLVMIDHKTVENRENVGLLGNFISSETPAHFRYFFGGMDLDNEGATEQEELISMIRDFFTASPESHGLDVEKVNYLVVDTSGGQERIVGSITAYRHGDLDQFAIYINSKNIGQGYGKKATRILTDLIKKDFVEREIYWRCQKGNIGSAKTALSCGFHLVSGSEVTSDDGELELLNSNCYKKDLNEEMGFTLKNILGKMGIDLTNFF